MRNKNINKEEESMCYTIPAASSVVTTILWSKTRNPHVGQLNTLFYGATIFGVVDHLWNGELFMISPNIGKDLMLGVTITLTVVAAWGINLVLARSRSKARFAFKA
ncbi:MAG: hypothetical protein HQL18_04055 [Candidatus Omnitrophica bacterium]|nr:hypothetical protein [Candidatus Omnitrophota bacterium]